MIEMTPNLLHQKILRLESLDEPLPDRSVLRN